jgi:hypothetical protein
MSAFRRVGGFSAGRMSDIVSEKSSFGRTFGWAFEGIWIYFCLIDLAVGGVRKVSAGVSSGHIAQPSACSMAARARRDERVPVTVFAKCCSLRPAAAARVALVQPLSASSPRMMGATL